LKPKQPGPPVFCRPPVKLVYAGVGCMLWYKHLTDARNDPFIWDLRQRFGPAGYFVYFATLEIYADNFKALPGWFLDISIDYLKHELQIYHASKLKQIINFIRTWPHMDAGAEDRPLMLDGAQNDAAPKWIAKLTEKRIALLIPTFSRMMDNYTAQKLRESMDAAQGKRGPAESAALGNDVLMAFRDIARDCEALAGLPAVNGRQFDGPAFVRWCFRNDYHPGAIRDGTAALVGQSRKWGDIKDPWAYARGVVKTRAGFYSGKPDTNLIRTMFGSFFNGASQETRGNDANSDSSA
jgi:hypothetical protein